MKVNPDNYDYIAYVDASGCDGYKFDNGSTSCYAVAAFLVRQEDVEHNLGVLHAMKQIVGAKDTDEIKHSTLRKHFKADSVFPLLGQLRGQLCGHVAFKKEIKQKDSAMGGVKIFSPVCHLLALRSISRCVVDDGAVVLIAIDRMKKTEEEPVSQVANDKFDEDLSNFKEYNLVFRDSKDKNFTLIQVADLFAGIIREFFERYETDEDLLFFRRICPPCFGMMRKSVARKHALKSLCRSRKPKSLRGKILTSGNFKYAERLFPKTAAHGIFNTLKLEPVIMGEEFYFIICPKIP